MDQIRVLTEQELRSLLKTHCETGRPVVIDWVNRKIEILTEEKAHPTVVLSGGPMKYRDVIFQIR